MPRLLPTACHISPHGGILTGITQAYHAPCWSWAHPGQMCGPIRDSGALGVSGLGLRVYTPFLAWRDGGVGVPKGESIGSVAAVTT